jgi:hypothetical protein
MIPIANFFEVKPMELKYSKRALVTDGILRRLQECHQMEFEWGVVPFREGRRKKRKRE